MPTNIPQGLKGLRGLSSISSKERAHFLIANADKIEKFRTPDQRDKAAEILYMNQQFISRYGIDAFNAMNNGTEDSFNVRNEYMKEDVVNKEFEKLYSPFDAKRIRNNNVGLGSDWEKYNALSTDAKMKVLESGYLTNKEFEDNWKKGIDTFDGRKMTADGKVYFEPRFMGGTAPMTGALIKDATYGEATKKRAKDGNDRILEHIYNDDADAQAKKLGTQVSKAYMQIVELSDDEVKKAFVKAITPGNGNMGISEYASHYGKGGNGEVTSEMKGFTIDEMRQVLAKKAVYDANMSPQMATTALNNDAKRYIKEHQGTMKRLGLFANDVGISALSYTADKVNGIYNIGLMAADKIAERPTVWVDDRGEVLDPNKMTLKRDNKGRMVTQDAEGNWHFVHQAQMDRTTLHNMGRRFDGSEDTSLMNQQYWTRAEQFGTLDAEEQKQYEKLGSSPYKVAYNPNEDSDLIYEAFKMMSFGIADAGSMLIPFGIGAAGRALSTASKVGKAVKTMGKAMDWTGKMLTAQSKTGQVIQGTAGALGIANAYQRGAFQETLAKNMADAEEAMLTKSKNDIYNAYNTDKKYKANVDKMIASEAVRMKNAYIAQAKREGMQIADEEALDKMIRAKAQDAVMGRLVEQKVTEAKGSEEYAQLQQKAIDGAGDAAMIAFLPEAVKYGFVNTLGYRKYLYTNPTGLVKKVSPMLKGLTEKITTDGKKRLATEGSKFQTRTAKLKQLGKTAGSQFWGGAWTNGTDDMQVDAAERINEDSFSRYLNQYQNGEAIADTYGFIDGIFSYIAGLQNSMGQETTGNAALVGGLGSIVNFTPNFANLAHLATKEGREAYKNNFWRELERDKNGNPLKDENRELKYKDLGKKNLWRDQVAYFIQNGVLSEYYGAKQNERDLRNHAAYVNNILDNYSDFEDIEKLVASDFAVANAEGVKDQKTAQFIKALNAVNVLNKLGNSDSDAAGLSSVVANAKALVEKAAQLNSPDGASMFSEEEVGNLLSQYYAANKNVEQNDANNQKALYTIAENAQTLMKASEAFDKAEEEIQKIERNEGKTIDPAIRTTLKIHQALNGHWEDRVAKMKEEIEDMSSDESPNGADLVASVGGIKNANSLVTVYEKQEAEFVAEWKEQRKKTAALHEKTVEALDAVNDATKAGDSDARLKAEEAYKKAKAEEENSRQQEKWIDDMRSQTEMKRLNLQLGIRNATERNSENKVLTADEIFKLDAITRARMLKKENRNFYSKEQQREIEALKQQLMMKDADALQKVQDIASLTQRIHTNRDAYIRMIESPEAAVTAVEEQRIMAADAAQRLIMQRSAEDIADAVTAISDGLKGKEDVSEEDLENTVYKMLRPVNSDLLGIIQEDNLLPEYESPVNVAKRFKDTVGDIMAVIKNADKDAAWKQNVLQSLNAVVENSITSTDLRENLERVIDANEGTQAAEDYDYILKGLETLGYQRDATVVENREARRQREAEAKAKLEAEEAARKKEAEEAAAKAAIEPAGQPAGTVAENAGTVAATEENNGNTVVNKGEVNGNDAVETATPKDGNEAAAPGTAAQDNGKDAEEKEEDGKDDVDIEKEKNGEGEESEESEDSKDSGENEENGDTAINMIEETEEGVQGKEVSIDEQASEALADGVKVEVSDSNMDAEAESTKGERSINTDSTTLSGNAMSEYEMGPLANQKVLKHKKGARDGDPMNKYFDWMKAAGIKLQNIIDQELGEIIKRNPHAKVKFMTIRSAYNATNDADMKNHLMLVLDYDNNVNKGITNIHNDANGGVITTNGKKYLIVGVAGYGNRHPDKLALYDTIFSQARDRAVLNIKARAGKFFMAQGNEAERFYVEEGFSTEIVPNSIIPGYLVKQMEEDETAGVYRSISELLSDEKRNPLGLDWDSLAWGIQEVSKFLTVNASTGDVMIPRKPMENLGNGFVLVPASNGKLVPVYFKALMYSEMRDGALKDEVNGLLEKLTAPKYTDRYDALLGLLKIFYLSKEGDNILLDKHENKITLVKNGIKTPVVLDGSFDREKFLEAFADFNPRVNITVSVLNSTTRLKQYDEAGAFMTDTAMLATAGSSYSVYGLNKEGKMIKPEAPENEGAAHNTGSDYRRNDHIVIYKGDYYNEDNGVYYLNGVPVTDAKVLEQLKYNNRIVQGKHEPAESRGKWDYYVLSVGENAEVVKRDRNTKEVKVVTTEEADAFIARLTERAAKEDREKAAEREVNAHGEGVAMEEGEAADLGEDDVVIDPVTGEVISRENRETPMDNGETASESGAVETAAKEHSSNNSDGETGVAASKEKMPTRVDDLGIDEHRRTTQTFTELLNGSDMEVLVKPLEIIESKWADAPIDDIEALSDYLKKKDVDVETIGTSEADVEAWIKTLRDCR